MVHLSGDAHVDGGRRYAAAAAAAPWFRSWFYVTAVARSGWGVCKPSRFGSPTWVATDTVWREGGPGGTLVWASVVVEGWIIWDELCAVGMIVGRAATACWDKFSGGFSFCKINSNFDCFQAYKK